jgi:hypothetical protein
MAAKSLKTLPLFGLALASLLAGTPAHAQFGDLTDDGVTAGDEGRSSYRGRGREGRGGEGTGQDGPQRRNKVRVGVSPYLEINQTAFADIKGGNGGVRSYTTAAAGVSVNLNSGNLSVSGDARYEYQFGVTKNTSDQQLISGIVNGRYDIIRNTLGLQAGALATRQRADGFVGANGTLGAGATNNVYSGYIGPDFQTAVGPLAVKGSYRFGYNRIETDTGFTGVGGPVTGFFDRSTIHNATASVGMKPGDMLPFGWTVRGDYMRENTAELNQHFISKGVRAEAVMPITQSLAAVGSVGYEKVTISAKDALRDVNGVPQRDTSGRLITNPASPQALLYNNSGLVWDAGVQWRPGPRTMLEARVGRRYGSWSYTGTFTWQPGSRTAIAINLFDSIDSQGRALNGTLANLPTNFEIERNPFSGDVAACLQGLGQNAGACFNDALAGIASANYRSRGIYGQFTQNMGDLRLALATGYSRRRYIGGSTGALSGLNGLGTDTYFGNLSVTRELGEGSAIGVRGYVNYFDPLYTGGNDVFNAGGYVNYSQAIGRRLVASAALGIDSVKASGVEQVITALGQIGLRYQF